MKQSLVEYPVGETFCNVSWSILIDFKGCLKYSINSWNQGMCLPRPHILLNQRWSVVVLKTVATSPPVARRSNPQRRGAHQVGRERRETPLSHSPPIASNGHRF